MLAKKLILWNLFLNLHIFLFRKKKFMALNYIWIGFFALTFVFALFESIVNGDIDIWSRVMSSSFDSAKTAFELSLGLTGVLSLWMGIRR